VGWVPFQWPSPSERGELFRLRGRSCRGITRRGRQKSVFDVYARKISFRSRSWLARPNNCILRALILLTVPSTAPECMAASARR